MENFPIYKLVITDDPNDSFGVDTMSLVKDPAIEIDFMAFSKQNEKTASSNFKFSITDQSRQIVSGPAMIPNMPIYRKDPDGTQYFVYADAQTIEQIVQKFFKTQRTKDVSIEHDGKDIPDVYLFESFLIDPSRGINAPSNYPDLPVGTWFTSYKVENQNVWNDIKSGHVKGFSIEGIFAYQKTPMTIVAAKENKTDMSFFNEIKNLWIKE